MHLAFLVLLAGSAAFAATGNLVTDVRALIARGEFAQAEKEIAARRAREGPTIDVAEATSWLGRGALAARKLDDAERYAAETRKLSLDLLRTRKLDAERHLPLALGASIEVHAQVMAARGNRSEAVEFLRTELASYGSTSIHDRIQKNINLLSLEGKPAPPLDAKRWMGTPAPDLKSKPVLLFLWAHWCGDCKGMVPVLSSIVRRYSREGLTIVGPTKLYGYAAGGMDAPPDAETRYIEEVRKKYYAPIGAMPVPLSSAIFREYGVSTTPTLVLIDRNNIVRMYHPGAMPEQELASRIDAVLAR